MKVSEAFTNFCDCNITVPSPKTAIYLYSSNILVCSRLLLAVGFSRPIYHNRLYRGSLGVISSNIFDNWTSEAVWSPNKAQRVIFLFLDYQNGKYTAQRIDIIKFTKIGNDIAIFSLNIKSKKYFGHSFCRYSAILLVNVSIFIFILLVNTFSWRDKVTMTSH